MPFEFGDIVLAPFPFTDQSISKKRPASHRLQPRLQCCQTRRDRDGCYSQLRASAALGEVWLQDWKSAGLLKPSAIKPVFATLERSLVIRQLGSLATVDREALHKAIRQTLG